MRVKDWLILGAIAVFLCFIVFSAHHGFQGLDEFFKLPLAQMQVGDLLFLIFIANWIWKAGRQDGDKCKCCCHQSDEEHSARE